MIMLKNYEGKILDKFEKLTIEYDKVFLQGGNSDDAYGDMYAEIQKTVRETLEEMINDIKKELEIKVNYDDYI